MVQALSVAIDKGRRLMTPIWRDWQLGHRGFRSINRGVGAVAQEDAGNAAAPLFPDASSAVS